MTSFSEQSDVSGKNGLHHPLRALRTRDFRFLWIGQTISSLGNAIQAVALTWLILGARGSAIDLALVLFFLSAPQALLTFVGGILIDRLDARSVMILADSLRIVSTGVLALLASNAAEHLWLVWLVLVFHGTGNALFIPASSSIAPRLVKADDLESANAMGQIGPLIGYLPAGLLVVVGGPGLAFALNAISYAVAVVLTLCIRPLERVPQSQSGSIWHNIREVASYLRAVPWLTTMVFMDVLVAFSAIITNSIGSPLLAKSLHTGAQGYSLFAWSYSVGAVLGFLLPAFHPLRSHRGLICIICQAAEALLMTMIAFVPLPLGSMCMIAWSMLNGLIVIVTLSLIQQYIPQHMLGRIVAFWMLASTGVMPFAQLMGGVIANAINLQGLFVLAGGLVLLGSVLGGSVPALRRLN